MRVKTPERDEERKENAKRKHHNVPSETEPKRLKLDRDLDGKLTTPPIEFSESSDDKEEAEEEEEDDDEEETEAEEEEEDDDEEETEEQEEEEDDDEEETEEEEDKKMKSENSRGTFLGEFQGKFRTPRIDFTKKSSDDDEEEEDKKMKSESSDDEEEEEKKMKSEISQTNEFRRIIFPETSELAKARFKDGINLN
nr:glutamic acid-rich protein-like [Solanum lycopersicum]